MYNEFWSKEFVNKNLKIAMKASLRLEKLDLEVRVSKEYLKSNNPKFDNFVRQSEQFIKRAAKNRNRYLHVLHTAIAKIINFDYVDKDVLESVMQQQGDELLLSSDYMDELVEEQANSIYSARDEQGR